MSNHTLLNSFKKNQEKKHKEMALFKTLKKEVETGANGTQSYVIKKVLTKIN
tara:strand:+ start:91 stop:246 length:156 start_codon:yes stop_codon:yes gene_type:complete